MLTFKQLSRINESNYGPGDWGWGLPPDVDMKFKEMAHKQRGAPESQMIRVQQAMGGGVLSPVVEHIGDLTNRISPAHPYNWAIDESLNKIDRCLSYLTNRYGFERELEGNIRANCEYRKQTPEEFKAKLDRELTKYAEEHSKLPVYNEVQWHARQAAVEVGRQYWWRAIDHLRKLKDILENHPERTKEHNKDLSQYEPPDNKPKPKTQECEPCKYPWQRAADKSRCGKRASTIK